MVLIKFHNIQQVKILLTSKVNMSVTIGGRTPFYNLKEGRKICWISSIEMQPQHLLRSSLLKTFEKLMFDLPLFTTEESMDVATNLCHELIINLELAVGVPTEKMDDWLEERFGGVVGYIVEM